MVKIKASFRFRARLKLYHLPAYKVCQMAGVNPSTLTKLICGVIPVKPGDERIVAVGKILGLRPEECFERVAAGEGAVIWERG